MEKVVVLSQDELRNLVFKILDEYQNGAEQKNFSESMSVDEAAKFLTERGFPISKSKLYKLTASNDVPHGKYFSRLSFCPNKLLQWAKDQTISYYDNSDGVLGVVKGVYKTNLK